MRRFAEFHNLQGAFGRRATIEQAKGILMARNGIDADEAFALLKLHSQRSGQKLVDVAEAITRTHMVLTPDPAVGAPTGGDVGRARTAACAAPASHSTRVSLGDEAIP